MEWIKLNEQEPEKEKGYIVFANRTIFHMYYGLNNDGGYSWWLNDDIVRPHLIPTHYMHLPKYPTI